MSVISVLGKLSQEAFKSITNPGYTDRPCLNKEKQIQSGEARAEEKTPALEHITKSQRRSKMLSRNAL